MENIITMVMCILKRICWLLFVVGYAKGVLANEPLQLKVDKSQQQLFLKAEKLSHKTSSAQYQDLYNQLHYYPLQPYLDQRALLKNMKLSSAPKIAEFLKKHKGTPLDWPVRKAWLKLLAKKNKAKLFVDYFKPTSNAELNCRNHIFQLQMGIPESVVLKQVTKLWLVGKSQDKVCDPLFDRWQKAGYRTNDVVWQRIALAADGGKHTLIPYLTKLLPAQQKYLAKLWHKVRKDPSLVSKLKHFPNKSVRETEILTYGLKRLIWRYPDTALKSYKKARQKFTFTQAQKLAINKNFAVALAAKNHSEARVWLDKLAVNSLDKNMLQWRLTQALKNKDWHRLISELKQLPAKYKDELQWKYWYARALIATGAKKRGQYLMEQLAHERHYYGFSG